MPKQKPKGRNDGHIFDYSKITGSIYVGSDLCRPWDCPPHEEEFKKLNICAEINLSDERREKPPKDIDSATWLPVVDGYPPNEHQMDMGTAIINETVSKGKNIYVHCKNGHGRSPTLVAGYLIRYKGLKADDAVELVKKKRPEIHLEDEQLTALKGYENKWQR